MTAFMNRSIDFIRIGGATGNRINLNRRGYLFATAISIQPPGCNKKP
jgi:hypothetical protein